MEGEGIEDSAIGARPNQPGQETYEAKGFPRSNVGLSSDCEESMLKEAGASGINVSQNGELINDSVETSSLNSGTKTCLTSRRVMKRVVINEVPILHEQHVTNQIANNIDKLENSFQLHVSEIRQALITLEKEKQSMDLHIKSIEDSLIECNARNKEYEVLTIQYGKEINELKESLESCKATNSRLLGDKENLQSEHSDHLQHIANQHRRKRIARRTIDTWKRKVKRSDSNMVTLLQRENEKIKEELMKYQEEAKQAFLRSAHALNSEALAMFQNSNIRLLQPNFSLNAPNDDSISLSSDCSRHSGSSPNEGSYQETGKPLYYSNGKTNEEAQNESMTLPNQLGKPNSPHSKIGLNKQFIHKSADGTRFNRDNKLELSDDDRRAIHGHPGKPGSESLRHKTNQGQNLDSRSSLNQDEGNPQNLNKNKSYKTAYVADYVPDALRRETRQIMQQLQNSKKLNLLNSSINSSNHCKNSSHIHICHCASQAGLPTPCQYCTSKQNYNFAKMPLPRAPEEKFSYKKISKPQNPKMDDNCEKPRNIVFASIPKENKTKVIYQPSGSTVVIEKHIQM